jgi:hypothetical protein
MKKISLPLLLLFAVNAAFAQHALKTVEVNVFKNGTYFIAKEGSVPVRKGYAGIDLPAAPLLGTYWISPGGDTKITEVSFITDTIRKFKNPENMLDIFKGSTGKKVKLLYRATDKDFREISGTLLEFYPASGLARIRQQDNKTTYLKVSDVLELSVDELSPEKLSVDSLVRVARIKTEKSGGNADLRVVYMQAGIQWFPSYLIRMLNDKEVQLDMQALVENYAEAVDNADLTLTVGSPQFYFGSSLDPMAGNYLSSIYDARPAGSATIPVQSYYSNAIYAEDRTASGYSGWDQYYTFETEGEKSGDLYMYKLGKKNLPARSKSSFQIFSVKIPYEDLYEVSVNDVVNYSYNAYISNDPEQRFDVFHSLRLTNTTSFPFTTAPAFVMDQKSQPLAQDRIKYTPTASNVTVQLSKAGDVVVKNKEEELKKEDNVRKVGKTYYNKVTIRGTIYIENLQDKKIKLTLKKNLLATVLKVSDSGVITKSGRYSGLNPSSDISWDIPLSSGEKKSVTYEYEVFAPAGGSY